MSQQKRELLKRLLQQQADESTRGPASVPQRRLWFVDRLVGSNPAYNITYYVKLNGELDVDLLERSLVELRARQAALRTRFDDIAGSPQQVVQPEAEMTLTRTDLSGLPVDVQQESLEVLIGDYMATEFDFSDEPLARTQLVKISADSHVLVTVIHHIIADGWSVNVMVNDLFEIYRVLRDGGELPPGLPLQYLDFTRRQLRWQETDDYRNQLAYWKGRLEGMQILDMPIRGSRPRVKGYRGAAHGFTLAPDVEQRLVALCEQTNTTMYMLLMAVYSILLRYYSGQDDIIIGSPIANRKTPDVEGLIGFFANVLPMRTDLSDDPAFETLLRQVSDTALEAYDNQDMPFDLLVDELDEERDPSRNPVFQVTFALQNAPMTGIDLGNLQAQAPKVLGYDICEYRCEPATRFDLELHCWHDEDGIRGLWVYDTALFEPAMIERMSRHYVNLLTQVAADSKLRVSDLSLLGTEEFQHQVFDWNRTISDFPRDSSLASLFEEQAALHSQAIALEDGDRRYSYAELNARANQLARCLVERGLVAGDTVGVMLERSAAMITAWLAILKAGGAYVPLDLEYPTERLEYMLEDSKARLCIVDGTADRLRPGSIPVLDLARDCTEIDAQDTNDPALDFDGHRLAYLIYTSGSTGQPKGVAVSQRAVARLVRNTDYFQPGTEDRIVQASNASFDATTFEVWGALLNGGALVMAPRDVTLSGARYRRFLRDRRITAMFITTALFNQISRETPDAFGSLDTVMFGGEAVDVNSVRRILAAGSPPRRLLHVYGPTESTTFASWYEIEQLTPDATTVPIGKPLANTQLYVLDERRLPVPVGVTGELFIGGDGLADGYWERPELTAERFVENPLAGTPGERLYRTGDLVRWDDDGNVEYLGRIDNQVKLRGFRIEPGEIEVLLRQCPNVEEALVLLREDNPGDKRLVAYLVAKRGTVIDISRVNEQLREQMPSYMLPSACVLVDRFPLTQNGKVDTRALPRPDQDRRLATDLVPADNDLEKAISAIWKEELGIEQVGVEDNFFDLGGHSLLVAKVHSRLKQLLDRELPIVTLFQYPTIRSLARLIQDRDTPAEPDALVEQQAPAPDYRAEAVAIIGIAGRFPGAANVEEFWNHLRAGDELIHFFSADELRDAGVDEAIVSQPNFVPAKGYLQDADKFDAQFFGYSPREAGQLDPQHRVFMEVAWTALEDAGYDPERYPGDIGVYAGASENSYWFSMLREGLVEDLSSLESALSSGKDFLASRVAYKLNLHGPALTVQSACSTSLVAVHEACKSLFNGEADMAIAGGVSVTVPLVGGYLFRENSILSPDGHCRAFDAQAQGTVGGDGAAAVVLKRLSRAQSDGDQIHAIIRGSAINNDGSDKIGYTAPSVDGQSRVIGRALRAAQVEPASIGYIESHGTGTPLGDPIEITALKRVFADIPDGRIAIGALKSNTGHLDAAAGVAGLIKAVLALEHAEIPPTLHFHSPNPELNLERTPFYVNASLQNWPDSDSPRRAGVSSFGIGGTNAHVVLEQAPARVDENAKTTGSPQLLLLSARSDAAVEQMAHNLAAHLERHPRQNLADVAYTLQTGRKRFNHFRALVCADVDSAIAGLRQGDWLCAGTGADEGARRVVFMFPGQGSQYVGMAGDIYRRETLFREIVDECCGKLVPELGLDLRELLYPVPDRLDDSEASLSQTRFTQPALFVTEYALARLMISWGISPAAMVGHSLGEYVAACLAGVMSLEDALQLVAARARLMSQMQPGKMLTVPLDYTRIESLLDDSLELAAINGPSLCVVSGCESAIDALRTRLADQGVEASLLHTSHAFHSAMMEPMLQEFAACLARVSLNPPRIPYLSNLTGSWISAEDSVSPDYYLRHLRHTVRFADDLQCLFEHEDWLLLEVGPSQILSGLARRNPQKPSTQSLLSTTRHPHQERDDHSFLLETVVRLWADGVEPDWNAWHINRQPARVSLPTYPFEQQRFWALSDDPAAASSRRKSGRLPNPDDWTYLPSWRRVGLKQIRNEAGSGNWLCFIDDAGVGERLAAALRAGQARVVTVAAGESYLQRGEFDFVIDAESRADYAALLEHLRSRNLMPARIVHLWSVDSDTELAKAAVDENRQQLLGFDSLVCLLQTLDDFPASDMIDLAVVTSNVHDVDGSELICPAKAMVLAPCKVIGMEAPGFRARSIDLSLADTAMAEALAERLVSELTVWRDDPPIAYRGPYRWVQHFEPVRLLPPLSVPLRLREGGVYLITGGLGRMGLEIADYLVRRVGARVALVSRRELPAAEKWHQYLNATDDEYERRLIGRLQNLGDVLTLTADVGDSAQMSAALARTEEYFGTINGLIHCAGVEKTGSPLRELESAECERQFLPRQQGLKTLAELIARRRLDFCLVNSSLASILGVMDFTSYTAAHQYMDAFVCAQNRVASTPWQVVDWDNWYFSDELEAEPAGYFMYPEQAIDVLDRVFDQSDLPQVIISSGDLQSRIEQWSLSLGAASADELDSPPGVAYARPRLSTEYRAPSNAIEQELADIWCAVLGLEQVGVDDNFFELGGDSVLNIQITARANEAGLKLTPRQIFEHQTIAELAAVAGTEHLGAAEQGLVTGEAPLTPIQQWFFERDLPTPQHFNLPMVFEIERELDLEILAQALKIVINHHDTLRARYWPEDDGWHQAFDDAIEPPGIHHQDLSELAAADRAARIEAIGADLQAGLDLQSGQLVRAAYISFGGECPPKLVLVIHHLSIDIVSWQFVIEDLQTAYHALAADREPRLPRKTTSFKQWAECMLDYAQTADAEAELEHWRGLARHDRLDLPVDMQANTNLVSDSAQVRVELDVDASRTLLVGVPQKNRVGINEVLLCALARTIADWSDNPEVYLDLEGHGREPVMQSVDPSRTVGWFTSLFPALIDLADSKDPVEQLQLVHRQMTAIPNHGFGFGVLRYMSRNPEVAVALQSLPRPQISFLFARQIDRSGDGDSLFRPVHDSIGPAHGAATTRPYLIEVNCLLWEGRFEAAWTYNRLLHRRQTIEALADNFITQLNELVGSAERPDFEQHENGMFFDADIGEDDLAEILRQTETID